jgi:hypothetical protein
MANVKATTKKRRKRVVISQAEAVQRLEIMVPRIEEDVKIGLWAEATLEAANEIVLATPRLKRPGALAYRTISKSLALNLAVSLARLFDPGSRRWHPNKRDIASIPLIIRLLKQRRCQKVLVERARSWTPHLTGFEDTHADGCQRSINMAINAYNEVQNTPEGRAMLRRLRDFRNKRLAHSMMQDTLKALPRYKELFTLMDVARDATEGAKLAIDGQSMGLKDSEKTYREEADDFWRMAFRIESPTPEAD